MPRTIPWRLLVAAPVVLVAILAATTAPALPPLPVGVPTAAPAPEPRAAPQPFDLTYLPRPASEYQAVVALRPTALCAHPAIRPYVPQVNVFFRQLLKDYAGIRGATPGLDALDAIVLCGTATVKPNDDPATKAEKPSTFTMGGTLGLIRTAKPYDWAAAVRTWFPTTPRAHGGVEYQTTPLTSIPLLRPFFSLPGVKLSDSEPLAFYTPDGRTLVIDTESRITALIDRVKVGKKAPVPPGWEKVSRAMVAVAVDNRDKKLIANLPHRPGPELPDPSADLLKAADHLAVGLDVGPTTRLRVVASCPQQFAGKKARAAWRRAQKEFADRFALGGDDGATPDQEAATKLADALLLDGKTTPTPLGFEYVGEVPDDLLSWFVRTAAEPARPASPPKQTGD